MSELMKLVDEVLVDAELFDTEVTINVDSAAKTMGVTFKDDVDTIRYYVNDTVAFWEAIKQWHADEEVSQVDAFWSILNTDYKI